MNVWSLGIKGMEKQMRTRWSCSDHRRLWSEDMMERKGHTDMENETTVNIVHCCLAVEGPSGSSPSQ
jgi:hypothetical protein